MGEGTAVEHLVYQDGNFGSDALMDAQPVKADECVRDMVGATQVQNQPRDCVENLLQTTRKIDREAYQGAVAVV